MERQQLFEAWYAFYARLEPSERRAEMEKRLFSLEERMRFLGRFTERVYHGFTKASLVAALGMAVGVHRQLLGGLTSASSGCILKGGGGALEARIKAR